jgi:hypothetical protein
MKRFIQLSLASFIAIIGLAVATPLTTPVGAVDVFSGACNGATGTTGDTGTPTGGAGDAAGDGGTASGGGSSSSICGAAKQDDLSKIITNVINAILFALGIAAVIMIVLGGIRYTTSNGDSGAITGAKNTILYAVVGLIVAIMAYTIVNFVLARLGA